MQIMYTEAASEAVHEIRERRKNNVVLVLCDSNRDALAKIAEQGGDPYKIAVIPAVEIIPDDLYVIGKVSGMQIVCGWNLPLFHK